MKPVLVIARLKPAALVVIERLLFTRHQPVFEDLRHVSRLLDSPLSPLAAVVIAEADDDLALEAVGRLKDLAPDLPVLAAAVGSDRPLDAKVLAALQAKADDVLSDLKDPFELGLRVAKAVNTRILDHLEQGRAELAPEQPRGKSETARRLPRLDIAVAANVDTPHDQPLGQNGFGFVENVSQTGARLRLTRPVDFLEPGELLLDLGPLRRIRALPIWQSRLYLGVRFLEPLSDQQLSRLMNAVERDRIAGRSVG